MCCRAIFCCGRGNTVSREVELAEIKSKLVDQGEEVGLLASPHGSKADEGTNVDPAGSERDNQLLLAGKSEDVEGGTAGEGSNALDESSEMPSEEDE